MIKSFRNVIKRMLIIVLSVTTAVAAVLSVACGCNPKEPESEYSVSINAESVDMIFGETLTLTAKYSGPEEQLLKWSSQDETVVTVNENGVVTAKDVGSATVKAVYGTAEVECKVSVSLGGIAPILQFNTCGSDDLAVARNESINLIGTISFNGRTYTDDAVKYSVENENVGKIENGIFYPLSLGETRVFVSSGWKGSTAATLNKTFKITVVDGVSFIVNGGKTNRVTLYTKAEHYGKTYPTKADIKTEVELNGVNKGELQPVIADNTIAEYTNNTLTAKSYGETTLTYSFESNGKTFLKHVPVKVERPVAKYNETFALFSAADGDGKGSEKLINIFGNDYVLTEAYQDGKPISVSADGKKVTGVITGRDSVTETDLTLYTETFGFILKTEAYTKVITEAEELKIFEFSKERVDSVLIDETTGLPKEKVAKKSDGVTYLMQASKDYPIYNDGYYYLANDIDATGTSIEHTGFTTRTSKADSKGFNYDYTGNGYNHSARNAAVAYIGFKGTFDGGGHSIRNLTLGVGGLFGNLCTREQNAVRVENVSFTDVILTKEGNVIANRAYTSDTASGAAKSYIENVNISVKDGSDDKGVVLFLADLSIYMNNVIVRYEAGNYIASKSGYGSLFGADFNRNASSVETREERMQNVFVISGAPLIAYRHSSGGHYVGYGVNETLPQEENVEEYKYLGVAHYTDYGSFMAEPNDFGSFLKSYCWKLSKGVPVWLADYHPVTELKINGVSTLNATVATDTEVEIYPYFDDEKIEAAEYKITEGEALVEVVSAGVFRSKANGTVKIEISYEYNGKKEMQTVSLFIEPALEDYDKTLALFSAADGDGKGDISFATIFGDDYKIIKAYQNDVALTISKNGKKALGVTTSETGKGETVLSVWTAKKAYRIKAETYTKVISTKEDLSVFDFTRERVLAAFTMDDGVTSGMVNMTANKNNTLYNEGYYYLANDIDATGFTIGQYGMVTSWASGGVTYNFMPNGDTSDVVDAAKYIGFRGVFEGNGHTISGLKLGRAGFFGNICGFGDKDITIRNVGFTNVTLAAESAARGGNVLASHVYLEGGSSVTIENIYIEVAENQYTRGIIAYANRAVNMVMNNVLIVAPMLTGGDKNNAGSLFAADYGMPENLETKNKKITNVYVVSNVEAIVDRGRGYKAYGANETSKDASLKSYVFTGLKRYATAEEMKNANNDYSSFTESGFWKTENGELKFK